MTKIIGYSHLSFSVTDLDRTTDWYRTVLGFELFMELETDDFQRKFMRHADADIVVTFTHHNAGSGDAFDERRTGLDHLAFAVPDLAALREFLKRFEALGIDHSPIKPRATGPGGGITIRDPDNIQLEVFATSA